jgi:hypothetical protein
MDNWFRIVNVRGNPYQMGVQYGEQARDLVRGYVDLVKMRWKQLGYSTEYVQGLRQRTEAGMEKQSPDLIQEIRGMAEGAKVSFDSLMNALASEQADVMVPKIAEKSCSCYAAVKKDASTRRLIIGHNWDSRLDKQDYVVLDLAKPTNGFAYITIGIAGRPGSEGLNERGVSIVISGVSQLEREKNLKSSDPLGVSGNWTHHIFPHCSTVDQVLEHCKRLPRDIQGHNWIVGDLNTLARVEIAYNDINVEYVDLSSPEAANCVMAATNHYPSEKMNHLGISRDEYPGTYTRYSRIMHLLEERAGEIDFDLMKAFSRDHEGAHPICRHGGVDNFTISAEIIEPARLRFSVVRGLPCRNEFRHLSL